MPAVGDGRCRDLPRGASLGEHAGSAHPHRGSRRTWQAPGPGSVFPFCGTAGRDETTHSGPNNRRERLRSIRANKSMRPRIGSSVPLRSPGVCHRLAARIKRYAPNVRLLRSAGCSLSVTADVRAKGSPTDVPDNRPLSIVSRRLFAASVGQALTPRKIICHRTHGCGAGTILGNRNDHRSRMTKRWIKIRNEKGANRT